MYSSKELSEELFKLSGWDETLAGAKERWVELPDKSWELLRLSDVGANGLDKQLWFKGIPAYTAGFLLRKLPDPRLYRIGNKWFVRNTEYGNDYKADTPEDCLALLAINLLKEGILQKEVK